MDKKPQVVVLGCNFAGLTVSRFIHRECKGAVNITAIDQKDYVNFIPNIPIEVFANNDPALHLEFRFREFLKSDGSSFLLAKVVDIDPENKVVTYVPSERDGSAPEKIKYDYLVVALGAKIAFDDIEGYAEFGHSFTDSFEGNKTRKYLHEEYNGGPIVIGSDRFMQGAHPKLPKIPQAKAACEGPPVEVAFSLADWLHKHKKGSAKDITLFTPGEIIAEDAGQKVLDQLLPLVGKMGYGYKKNTIGIKRLYKDGIEFKDGSSLEAVMKVIFPNWKSHDFLKPMPFVDDQGFVVTDWNMRNPDYPEIFAVGDAASVTVPKLGAIGHMEAEVVSKEIAKEVLGKKDEVIEPVNPAVVCFGDMGSHKGFYIHSNEWWGGPVALLKMGYTPYVMKMGFKEMYYRLGGKVPSWGMPLAEAVSDHI